MVLFANYKTLSVAVDDKGKKRKAQGGQRVLYTTHHPCWDGKNRHNLPDELPFAFDSIAAAIQSRTQTLPVSAAVPPAVQEPLETFLDETPLPEPPVQEPPAGEKDFSGLPEALVQLMRENEVSPFEIQQVVSQKGYWPIDTPIQNYDPAFIDGVLIGAWKDVFNAVLCNRDLPFD